MRAHPISLLVPILVAAPGLAHAKDTPARYVNLTSAGQAGTLEVTRKGSTVDVDWRVDDNGRGAKLKEHIELLPGGLAKRWEITGNSDAGAPVKESFVVDKGRAKWSLLGDQGEADGKDALYLPSDTSPWALEQLLGVLLHSKNHSHAALPSGTVRAEKLRDVQLGGAGGRETVAAWAIWGADLTPLFVLARGDRLVAQLSPGDVVVEEKRRDQYDALSKLAAELSRSTLGAFTTRLAHRFSGPVWITNVRLFDPTTGTLGATSSVSVNNGVIEAVRQEPPPADVPTLDGGGGTLMPGLLDAHAHLSDWSGPLHIAAGVTFVRDPGNDNATLLDLEPRFDSGELMGPRVRKSGFLEGKSPYSAHGGFIIDTLTEGIQKIRWYADHGYWGLKIYNSMKPELVKPLAAEAHRLGLHVHGHVPAFMTSVRVVLDGYDEITHVNQLILGLLIDAEKEDTRTPFRFTALGQRAAGLDLGGERFQQLLGLLKERHTWVDPTLAVFQSMLLARPGRVTAVDENWLDHLPGSLQRSRKKGVLDVKPAEFATYDASSKKLGDVVRALHEAGVPLVPGTDDVPGLMLHSELECWAAAGIPAPAVLQYATLKGARLLGLADEIGSIAPGKRADLYLVDGDPTRDIRAIRRGKLVIKSGTIYFPDEIYAALGVKPFATHSPVIAAR